MTEGGTIDIIGEDYVNETLDERFREWCSLFYLSHNFSLPPSSFRSSDPSSSVISSSVSAPWVRNTGELGLHLPSSVHVDVAVLGVCRRWYWANVRQYCWQLSMATTSRTIKFSKRDGCCSCDCVADSFGVEVWIFITCKDWNLYYFWQSSEHRSVDVIQVYYG